MYKVGTVVRLKGVVLGVLLRAGLTILIPFMSLGAGSVNLAWDASPDTGVVGYNVYYGTSTKSYPNMIPLGSALSTVLTGLPGGNTYYVAVTAVDSHRGRK